MLDATLDRTPTVSAPLLPSIFVEQRWAEYTHEQHSDSVWSTLYARRVATLHDTGSRVFL